MEDFANVLHTSLQLFHRQYAIVVRVKFGEHLAHFDKIFRLRVQVRNDRADAGLEICCFAIGSYVSADIQHRAAGQSAACIVLEPGIFEQLSKVRSNLWIFLEASLDELFRFIASASKLAHVRLRVNDQVVDVLFAPSRERCSASQERVADDTCRPHVHSLAIDLLVA